MNRSDFCIDFAAIRKIDQQWSSNLYWHVVDRIFFMPWPAGPSELGEALQIAPEGVRLFYLAGTIEGPVENGGLGQYFAIRRPAWLHEMAKKAICDFGCQGVVAILSEAERYLDLNREKLYDGIPWDEWVKVMGVVAMNEALDNINGRFLRACYDLDGAKERYLRKHRDRFE